MKNSTLPISEKVRDNIINSAVDLARYYMQNIPENLQFGLSFNITTKREMDGYYNRNGKDKVFPYDYSVDVELNVSDEYGRISLPHISLNSDGGIVKVFDYEMSIHNNKWGEEKEEDCNA